MSDDASHTDDRESSESLNLDTVSSTFETLERLHLDDLLSRRAYDRARTLLWPPSRAWKWFDRGLLFVGAALVLTGIVFLFAYNWAAIPGAVKLALVEGAVVTSLIGAGLQGWDTRVGRVGVIAASVFVGLFLAVFGQIYQTGADSWELFAGWAGLIAGYVVSSRSQGLWLLWIVLVHVAACLFVFQRYVMPEPAKTLPLFLGLGLVDGLILTLREWYDRGVDWLEPRWPRHCLVGLMLGMFCLPNIWYWTIAHDVHLGAGLISTGAWGCAVGGSYLYFRYGDFDRMALALVGVATLAPPVLSGTRWLYTWFLDDLDAGGLLIVSLLIFAATGLLVLWLRALPEELESSQGGEVS